MSDEEDTSRLVLAFIDFLRDQRSTRENFSLEDTDSLNIAIECLETAYGLESNERLPRRPLLDMFTQVTNPVSVKDQQEAESLKTEGNAQIEQENYQEADELYSRAIQADKWNAIYYCNRAAARIKLSQFFDAISDCRQALTLNPEYAKAYARMGQAYVSMDRPRMAASCFRQAVRLEPDNEKYKNNLSVAQIQAEESSTENMTALIQNVLGSIMGSPQGVPGGMGMSPFMIISEPQSSSEYEAVAGTLANVSSDSNIESRDRLGNQILFSQDDQRAYQDSSRNDDDSDDDYSVNLNLILGIPTVIMPTLDVVDAERPIDINPSLSESLIDIIINALDTDEPIDMLPDHSINQSPPEYIESNYRLHTDRYDRMHLPDCSCTKFGTIERNEPNKNKKDDLESNKKEEPHLRSNEKNKMDESSEGKSNNYPTLTVTTTETITVTTNKKLAKSVKQPQTNNQEKENEAPKNCLDGTMSDSTIIMRSPGVVVISDQPTDNNQIHLSMSENEIVSFSFRTHHQDSNDTLHIVTHSVSGEDLDNYDRIHLSGCGCANFGAIEKHEPNMKEEDEQKSNKKGEPQLRSNEKKKADKSSNSRQILSVTTEETLKVQLPKSVKQSETNNLEKDNETQKNSSDDNTSDPFKEVVDSMTASVMNMMKQNKSGPFKEIMDSMTANVTNMIKQNSNGKVNHSKSSESSEGQAERESKHSDVSQSNSNQVDDSPNRFKTFNNLRKGEKYDTSSENEDDQKFDSVEKDVSKKNEDDENEHPDGNNDKKSNAGNFKEKTIFSFLKMFGKSDTSKEGESSKKLENEQDSDAEKIKDPKKG